MDQDSAHMVATSKVPMLKPGEFEIWRMRIEQYIQMIDYALWVVIENDATLPKTTTVEAQYETLHAPSTEMLDQTFDRLSKVVSQLDFWMKSFSQEDVNQKLLRSLSLEWNTHVVVWRNKADLDTMRMDDLYNNLKVNITVNGNETIGFDKSKWVVLQLLQEWDILLRSAEAPGKSRHKNKESSRRSVPMGNILLSSTAMVSCLKSVEEKLEVYKANESIYLLDIKGLKFEIHLGEITIRELRKKLEIVQKEKDGIQFNVDKFENASKSLNKIIECQIVDNCKKGLGYNAVPPPYTRNFMRPTLDLSFTSLDELVNEPVVENSKAKFSEEEPKMEDMLLLERTPKEVKSQIGEGSVNLTDPHHTPTFIQPQKTQKPRNPRKDTQVPQSSDPMENVADETVQKELGDSLVRATTTSSSLEAEQDSGDITKTRSKATPNQSSSLETTSGGGPRCQETMGDTIARTRFESVSNILEIHARKRVLDLEKGQTTSLNNEIAYLKRRFKKLEKKNRSRTHKLKRLYKVGLTARVESSRDEESLGKDASKQRRINAIDADEEITIGKMKMLLKKEKAEKEKEANIALIETWDDIQAKIDADYQLAKRMQAQEQEELSIQEKATLFQQLLEKRRKHFTDL
ncbi:hypothetical protein Tco_1533349 [Tanacetum coccineum]